MARALSRNLTATRDSGFGAGLYRQSRGHSKNFDFRLLIPDLSKGSVYTIKNQQSKIPTLSQEKMECCFAKPKLVSAIEDSRLARREPDRIVDHGPVYRSQVFDKKGLTLAPDSGVATGDFGLGIEPRQVDLGKTLNVDR